jgi:hypothetical protein
LIFNVEIDMRYARTSMYCDCDAIRRPADLEDQLDLARWESDGGAPARCDATARTCRYDSREAAPAVTANRPVEVEPAADRRLEPIAAV